MQNSCAIIAGAGSFPIHVAREAKRLGHSVVAIGLQGWADPTLAQTADVFEEVSVGHLHTLIDRLKAHHIRQAVMAGKVTKEVLFDPRLQFDAESLSLLGRLKEFSVNAVLGAIATRLADDGIELLDSSTFLKQDLCPPGVLTQRQPTDGEREDIAMGVRVAQQMAQLDIGQTVVVKKRVIIAVEALEGTDATIQRASQLAGAGCVVVKMASPSQDMRFDLPILGARTVEVATACGVGCVAVEARKTLLLDRSALITMANDAQLSLVGVEPCQEADP
ncbi:MAG: UDP-2,3-diacylglucosamine diphosphatase LpxI [Candidatus Omnitrophica bacterium]|nr:UDP-2,3-diacylglucosamine diphosphatase LpxI [Candidatus Omnitrophota bacterium]